MLALHNYILVTMATVSFGLDTLHPAIEGDTIRMDCNVLHQGSESVAFLMWAIPGNRFVMHDSSDANFLIEDNKTLILKEASPKDKGEYVCLVEKKTSGVKESNLLRSSHKVPYVIVPKDYVKSFGIAMGAAVCFLLVAIGLMLLDKYRWKDEDRGRTNVVPMYAFPERISERREPPVGQSNESLPQSAAYSNPVAMEEIHL